MAQYLFALVQSLNAREEEGQGMVEYALIIALVAILLVGALTGLKTQIEGVFTEIGNAF